MSFDVIIKKGDEVCKDKILKSGFIKWEIII